MTGRNARVVQSELPTMAELLALAGFHIRSASRADCGSCSGRSRGTVSYTADVAFCHRCHWSANRITLARKPGLLGADPAMHAQVREGAQKRRRLYALGARLRETIRAAEGEAREEIYSLNSIRRGAGRRLAAIEAAEQERFNGEREFAWSALQFVGDHELRAHARYILAALAATGSRIRFALDSAEGREAMVTAAVEAGFVKARRGEIEVRA